MPSSTAEEQSQNEALFTAIQIHDTAEVERLIGVGVNPNAMDQYGNYALEMAACHPKNLQIVKLLIGAKADLNAQKSSNKSTTLISAAYFNCPEILDVLINAGAHLDEQDKLGRTALMEAAYMDNTDCVKRLLQANANANLINDEGKDARMIAKEMKHVKVVRLLRTAAIKFQIKKYFTQFKKHPSYYLFSAATRLGLGAIVGFGLFYGLTALTTLPYLAPLAQSLLYPKAIITAASLFSSLWASVKLANSLLLSIFGEIKLKPHVYGGAGDSPIWTKLDATCTHYTALLSFFTEPRPYKTSLEEVVDQLEKDFKSRNTYNPKLLSQSRTFALAYAKQMVEDQENADFFSNAEKAEVNTEPYILAAAKMT